MVTFFVPWIFYPEKLYDIQKSNNINLVTIECKLIIISHKFCVQYSVWISVITVLQKGQFESRRWNHHVVRYRSTWMRKFVRDTM